MEFCNQSSARSFFDDEFSTSLRKIMNTLSKLRRRSRMRPRICIYTAMFGGYDRILEHEKLDGGCEFIVFTDDAEAVPAGSLRPVICKNPNNQTSPILQNFWLRLFPFCVSELYGYDIIIYLDPNIRILDTDFLQPVLEAYERVPDFDLMLSAHPWRDCIYEESSVSQAILKYTNTDLERQAGDYRRQGFPAHGGLYWNGLIVYNRECNHSRLARFQRKYWLETIKYNKTPYAHPQGQVSLPFCLWKAGLKLVELPQVYASSSVEVRAHLRPALGELSDDRS